MQKNFRILRLRTILAPEPVRDSKEGFGKFLVAKAAGIEGEGAGASRKAHVWLSPQNAEQKNFRMAYAPQANFV